MDRIRARVARRDAIEKRRAQIAQLLDANQSQREIAEMLDVSVATVNNDIQVLRARWRRQQLDSTENVMLSDLHQIDTATAAIWLSVQSGELGAIDRFVRLKQLKASILGYKAPEQIDVKSGGKAIQAPGQVIVYAPTGSRGMEDAATEDAAIPDAIPDPVSGSNVVVHPPPMGSPGSPDSSGNGNGRT